MSWSVHCKNCFATFTVTRRSVQAGSGADLVLECTSCRTIATYNVSDVETGLAMSDVPIGQYGGSEAAN